MATSHCIEPICDVNITREQVDEICRRHGIASQHRQCYWRMIARGEILSHAFSRALVYRRNYERATAEILAIVDRDFDYDTPMPCPTTP
jgi:hypothetical protein